MINHRLTNVHLDEAPQPPVMLSDRKIRSIHQHLNYELPNQWITSIKLMHHLCRGELEHRFLKLFMYKTTHCFYKTTVKLSCLADPDRPQTSHIRTIELVLCGSTKDRHMETITNAVIDQLLTNIQEAADLTPKPILGGPDHETLQRFYQRLSEQSSL